MSESVVLYIEDEELMAQMVDRVLSRDPDHPHRLLWVKSLQEGLRALDDQEVDLILLDLNLPDSRGIETLDRIRSAAPRHPIVVLTGLSDQDHLDQVLSHGAQEYLPKAELTPTALDRAMRFARQRKQGEALLLNQQRQLETSLQERTRELENANEQLRSHIEERLRIEQTLRERDEQNQAMLENMPIPMAVYDMQGQLLFVNSAFINLFGWSRSELLGRKLDFVPSDMIHQLPERIEQMKRGEKVAPFETVRLAKDGHRVDVLISTAPFRDSLGAQAGNIVVFHDITDIKKAEKARAETERRYQSLVETMSEGLVEVDQDHNLLYFNESFKRMLGYSDEEMLGSPSTNLMTEQGRQAVMRAWDLRKKGVADSYEVSWRKKDGGVAFTLISGKPRFDSSGQFKGSIALITNITERKILEGQLLQAQKLEAIGQLAAGIAHEINTPTQYVSDNTRFLKESFADLAKVLASYRELAEAIKRSHPDDPDLARVLAQADTTYQEMDGDYLLEEAPRAIEQTLEGLNRIATIVRSMKEFAHPGPESKTPTDLNRAIQNTITVAKNEWKYVAEVVTDLDSNLPLVPCVPGQINQVILNIIVNAAQAIAETHKNGEDHKGQIKISTRQVGEAVEVRIADTGPGIPETVRGRVFDPFFTTKPPGKGTGQGLAIAYRVVVDKHGGNLSLDSEMGRGTTFVISLPLQDSELTEARP